MGRRHNIDRLSPSSDTWTIVGLHHETNPLLVIVNDAYTASRIMDEIKLFKPTLVASVFPDTEILPYERLSPQKILIANRIQTLWQINQHLLDIVIVPINTLQTRLCPKSYLTQRIFLFKLHDKLSIENIRQQLNMSDYTYVTQVYEPGEFSIRGGVIDIMPMGSPHIIRIELFDNEIESLYLVNHKTKEVLHHIDEYKLIPAREYPIDQESIKLFKNNFCQLFTNQHILKELDNNILPSGSEFYLPLFFEQTATLFDYLDDTWHIVYYQNAEQHLNLNWQEINRRYALYQYQYPCLKPIQLFITSDKVLSEIKGYTAYQIKQSGPLNQHISPVPDIAINKQQSWSKLKQWQQDFMGYIVLALGSIGRREIISQTLIKHNIQIQHIDDLTGATNPHIIYLIVAKLSNGFMTNNMAFITENDIYTNEVPANLISTPSRTIDSMFDTDHLIRDLAEIQIGDYVVHINHGIAKYSGLTTQIIDDVQYEMLELEYQDEACMFIPVNNLHLISRYSQLDNVTPQINKLGTKAWHNLRAKTEKKINDMAVELLELYTTRSQMKREKYNIDDTYDQFIQQFMYQLTPDQYTTMQNIITDMQKTTPMDRLICGDVGFGKTELAIRAAFICAMHGRQVAILTPTTLLTNQHYQNFVNRFTGFPIQVAELSRFKTKKEIRETLNLVAQGKIDILIGTHKLIQNDMQFANLGLIIIDEEHRFGVSQKEKLKQLRSNIDCLAMTATPIPRTLSMAIEGLRDFSIIATPPQHRLAINTIVIHDDNNIMREAILRETRRGGQVFFLYNNVANIISMYKRLSILMPEIEIAIAHGQMDEHILEQTIRDFIDQKYHLLLCSTIIESGIDIANANTILIYHADQLGLSQLHQLRGRVGRSHHQAYCYLIVPETVTRDAEKRLTAITSTTELGAGFNLAVHDLEIRGAGEILGSNQSGNIRAIGLSLYTDLLKKAVRNIKFKDNNTDIYCEVNLDITAIIPDDYCNNIHERLIYYKRLAKSTTVAEIDHVYKDLINHHGLAPVIVTHLISMHYLRIQATLHGIKRLDITQNKITCYFIPTSPISGNTIVNLLNKIKNCTFDGENKLIWLIHSNTAANRFENTQFILNSLQE